ncbi:MAG: clpP, partial [Mucilaginibacter sp.]|nr:clpP [Mucilaginibacter sp.]
GADYQAVWDASDRDHWMIAEEAKEFGMVDEILKGSKQ